MSNNMASNIKEGFLQKEGINFKTWKKRWIVLENNTITYYNNETKKKELGKFAIDKGEEIEETNDKKKKFCFKVVSMDRVYYFLASNQEEMQEWINACKTNVEMMKQLNNTEEDGKLNSEKINEISLSNTIHMSDIIKIRQIGTGSMGDIFLVKKRDTDGMYAMKAYNKKKMLERDEINKVNTEKNIALKIESPFINKLHHMIQTDEDIFFLTDYLGSHLFPLLMYNKYYNEEAVQFYAAQMVLALETLHHNKVLYRNLVPKNIMLDKDGNLCLIDYKNAKENMKPNEQAARLGNPLYLCPEMIKGEKYGTEVDWWAFGVVLYEMIVGSHPFFTHDIQRLFHNIVYSKLVVPDFVPTNLATFLEKLLDKDKEKKID